jgi:hypothetical protein
MKSSIIYIKPNPGISEECISVGLLFILDDGTGMFRWSKEKLSIAIKLAKSSSGENISGLRVLLRHSLKCMERYAKAGEKNMEGIVNHARLSDGLITYGVFRPFILFNDKTVEEVFDMFYDTNVLNITYNDERRNKKII